MSLSPWRSAGCGIVRKSQQLWEGALGRKGEAGVSGCLFSQMSCFCAWDSVRPWDVKMGAGPAGPYRSKGRYLPV